MKKISSNFISLTNLHKLSQELRLIERSTLPSEFPSLFGKAPSLLILLSTDRTGEEKSGDPNQTFKGRKGKGNKEIKIFKKEKRKKEKERRGRRKRRKGQENENENEEEKN